MAESPEAVHSPSREALRAHLEHVAGKLPHFRNSKRCSALLRYVVEHSVGNPHEPIKETCDRASPCSTGIPATTPIRMPWSATPRLKCASDWPNTIWSPDHRPMVCGSNSRRAPTCPSSASVSVSVGLPPTTRSWTAAWPWALALGLAMVTGVAGWLLGSQRSTPPAATELDQFWGPVLSAPHTSPDLCRPEPDELFFPSTWRGNASPSATVPRKALVPMWDRFFLVRRCHCHVARDGLFGRAHSKLYRIRGARNTPYAELQGNPVVLIGAFNNEWTIRLTEDLRFSLVNDSPTVRGVRDREQGKGHHLAGGAEPAGGGLPTKTTR